MKFITGSVCIAYHLLNINFNVRKWTKSQKIMEKIGENFTVFVNFGRLIDELETEVGFLPLSVCFSRIGSVIIVKGNWKIIWDRYFKKTSEMDPSIRGVRIVFPNPPEISFLSSQKKFSLFFIQLCDIDPYFFQFLAFQQPNLTTHTSFTHPSK